jgi:N-acetylneuraminic acid mutarotase
MKTRYAALCLALVVYFILPLTNAHADLMGITTLQPMNETRWLFGAAKGADGKIYVFGGVKDNGYGFSAVECYDPKTNSWTYRQAMPGPNGWQRAVTALDGKIYLFGGSTDALPSKDVWAYDPVANTWDTSMPQMPVEERDTVAVLGTDGIIYLFGGYGNYNAVQAFNPSTKTWQLKTPMPTGRWAAAGALGPDGKIYIVGGGYPGQPDYGVYNTLEVYDPATDSWATKSPMPTARNYLGAAFGADGKLYAFGGEVYGAGRTGIMYDVIEAYNPLTDTWETAGHLPSKLSALAAVSDNLGNIHCVGGYSISGVIGAPPTNLHYLLTTSVPIITVNIDIQPKNINRKSKGKIKVAILSSPTFNAMSIDQSTVKFAAGASPVLLWGCPKDVNKDGLSDIVLQFKIQDLNIQLSDTEACITGKTFSGQEFKGCDSVRIIK